WSIFAISSGNRATAFTFSSHGCVSNLAMLFVSFTKRAAITISTGKTAAGKMIDMRGSGWSAIGTASFSSSAALRLAGTDGGGTGLEAGNEELSGTAALSSRLKLAQKTS